MTAALSADALAAMALSVGAFHVGCLAYRRSRNHPLCHPIAVAVVLVIAVLLASGISYERYFAGAWIIHALLGPAVVALALPLYRNLAMIRSATVPILAGIAVGATTGSVTAIAIARLLHAPLDIVVSVSSKSATAAVSMELANSLGGIPALAGVVTVLTGIITAALGPLALDLAGIRAKAARGIAMGVTGHGLATARALADDDEAGAYAGLAMGLTAVLTAVGLPILWRLGM
ncbi:MAG: LrgB family protein [Hyphomicrobiaceae bacterium]|nr:LrgB family protein [Hyphomicrobiaceae bacterium]